MPEYRYNKFEYTVDDFDMYLMECEEQHMRPATAIKGWRIIA